MLLPTTVDPADMNERALWKQVERSLVMLNPDSALVMTHRQRCVWYWHLLACTGELKKRGTQLRLID